MSASRQDFVRIAAAIERIDLSRYKDDEYQQRKYIAVVMAHALAPTNPNFDFWRFVRACLGEDKKAADL